MFRPRSLSLIILSAAASIFSLLPQQVNAQVGPATATKLVFYNASNQDVAVGVSLQSCPVTNPPQTCIAEDGCPSGSLQNLKTIDMTANGAPTAITTFGAGGGSIAKGWFMLKRGHRVQVTNVSNNPYTGKPSYCMQGVNFGFGQFSATCPNSTAVPNGPSNFPITTPGPNFDNAQLVSLPNGSNGFEATINLPGTVHGQRAYVAAGASPTSFTPAGTQEFFNLTCVNGANCTTQVQVTPPASGPFWQTGGSTGYYKTTATFQNSWVDVANKCDNNCIDPKTGQARPGVFPYGCSQCNTFPDPGPPCTGGAAGTSQFCAAKNGLAPNNGCGVTRNPSVAGVQQFGGTIQVNYLGPLTPPGTCPPGTRQF